MTDHIDDTDIAIVGMAIRVPGASTPEQYWDNLVNGVESVQQYSDEELLERGVSRDLLANPDYVRAGMPLQDFDQFDPEFFGFSPKEAAILDPQHRQFYEVAWEGLERAGHPPEQFDGAVGVFAGCGMGAYFAYNILTNRDVVDSVGLFLLRHTGNDKDFLSTRVSYSFNLRGPSVNVQTACSTSLVATHLACQSLLSGECDMALAGGSTVELPHEVGYVFKEGEVLSPDGHCRTFDQQSKGTVFGSGTGVVVLRRLADAIEDGDHIHAVIKGSAVNNDGSGKVGYLAPSVDGQAAAVAEALAVADVDAESVTYIECHGTATPVGDPIEITALSQAFRESTDATGFCQVGSVKTNIGHLDTAAGVAGLIKAALAVEHGKIPASLHYESPNPAIDFESSPFRVAAQLSDWTSSGGPRRAGINSLGVGGTNAFVIIEEPPAPAASNDDHSPQLLVLSARSKRAVDSAADRLRAWLEDHPDQRLCDVAWTLQAGRQSFEHRRVFACTSREEAIELLRADDAQRVCNHSVMSEKASLVFMYPGGGAQYARMGLDLYEHEPVFREHIDCGLDVLKSRFNTDLRDVFMATSGTVDDISAALEKPATQIPLTFLVEYALTRLWESCGVRPEALIGHSLGENTAAAIAGVLSFEDALGLVLLRGQLFEQNRPGGMLSVPLSVTELRALTGDDVDIAAANGPQLSVASGSTEALDELAARLDADGVESQRIRIEIAAHSRHLDAILGEFRSYLRSIKLNPPEIPLVSNRTGNWLTDEQACNPEYWVEHLRNTVLFADGVDTLLQEGNRVFLEVGPGNVLGSCVRQNSGAPAQRVLPSMRHPKETIDDRVFFRTVIGRLWAIGVPVELSQLHSGARQRVPLPSYPFQHARYWIEPGKASAGESTSLVRPMAEADVEDWFWAPQWVQYGIREHDSSPRKWLIFHTNDDLAKTVVQRLRDAGSTVVSVLAGDTYARVDQHTYTLAPEAGGVGFQELIDDLAGNDLLPDSILHSWLLTQDRNFRPGSTLLHRNQEYGFYSLFHLAKALARSYPADDKLHLIVAGNGVQQVADEAVPHPDKATVLGPCGVIPRELPNLSCSFVDVALDDSPLQSGWRRSESNGDGTADSVAVLLEELQAPADDRVVAWRDGVRWQRFLRRTPVQRDADETTLLRNGGVYLLTGGFGGIAREIAAWLATTHQARLILVGRTPLPERIDWDEWLSQHGSHDSISAAITQVRHLESLGAEVMPASADVTVAEEMQQVLDAATERFGAINGVFHTAGVVRDNLLQLKSQREIEEVFAAKLYGTMVLDELFSESSLDFMLLFSSTSSFIAPQGQIDYVGASAFVNAFALSRRNSRPYQVSAVNWGIWKDVGMVAPGADELSAASVAGDMQRGSAQSTTYPLFNQRYSVRAGVNHMHTLTGTLATDKHWVVADHRLAGGQALLSGTGYIELIRAGLAEIGVNNNWEIRNLVFQNPLFVSDHEPRDFLLRLEGVNGRWEARILGATNDSDGEWEECANARITDAPVADADSATTAALSRDELEARCNDNVNRAAGAGRLRTRQEDHLRFGPRWKVLRELRLGSGEALAHLELSSELADDLHDYGLHPALLDIATGCAMDLIPGYAEQDVATHLWIPIAYQRFRYHAPLQPEMLSWIRPADDSGAATDFVAFDIVITDLQGRVLADVEQLTLRKTDSALVQAGPAAASIAPDGSPISETRRALSPGEEALEHNRTQGITVEAGLAALGRLLGGTLPSVPVVSSMPLPELLAQADGLTRAGIQDDAARFARPELDSDFEAPRDDIEKSLADLWGRLLGVEGVGIHDSFFDLGGHSLIAVRLFNEISDRYDIELPISALMQSPDIDRLGELIRGSAHDDNAEVGDDKAAGEKTPAPQFQHVVPMHSGTVAGTTPLFLVAGMFGNVLNLSHLAHLLGEDRPFYALQARGLYGDAEPHESFVDMAHDYIAELRRVQPEGPYLLGGFSGGGLVAWEMSRQLLEQGESVLKVIMLDTPVREHRHFSLTDKLSMLMQGLQNGGIGFITQKIRDRIEWEKQKRSPAQEFTMSEGTAMNFQSQRIGDAFVRAHDSYSIPTLPVDVALFRPKLDIRFRLSGDRLVDSERNFVSADNGWTPFVRNIEVFEVPGNHDSMVLEPNVRVMVAKLRRSMDDAEQ